MAIAGKSFDRVVLFRGVHGGSRCQHVGQDAGAAGRRGRSHGALAFQAQVGRRSHGALALVEEAHRSLGNNGGVDHPAEAPNIMDPEGTVSFDVSTSEERQETANFGARGDGLDRPITFDEDRSPLARKMSSVFGGRSSVFGSSASGRGPSTAPVDDEAAIFEP